MYNITIVSLSEFLETMNTCFILRTLVTQHIKIQKSTVHFLYITNIIILVRLFRVL
jgi:hypothetical protein